MPLQSQTSRTSLYERITHEIVAAIEAGPSEFSMPWHHDGSPVIRPVNVATGKPYRGVNILALWAAGAGLGFSSGLWGTYRQWAALGASVRKGERASTIVFWKTAALDSVVESEKESSTTARVIARGYAVFNADQIEGFAPPPSPVLSEALRIKRADDFLSALDVTLHVGGASAYYRPSTDSVYLPDFDRFYDPASFYAVAFHECAHASSAKHRLDRDLTSRFGTQTYAAEEICVELAAGFILADLEIAHNPRPDHAGYIASWIDLLKDDPRAIFTAASKAQAIADWMHAKQTASDVKA